LKLATLNNVQEEVTRQLVRDYGAYSTERLQCNVTLGLAEEAGEVAGLMKRVLRNFPRDQERIVRDNFVDELGDVLWYLAACCAVHCTSLEEIWEHNKDKLKERYGE
jgi:NTP pyrophosphatase (non-canonical NTP hydrolase)